MDNVTTLKKQRTVGELTAEDLGIEIQIGNDVIRPVTVTHMINESLGVTFTEIREDGFFAPLWIESDHVFTVVEP